MEENLKEASCKWGERMIKLILFGAGYESSQFLAPRCRYFLYLAFEGVLTDRAILIFQLRVYMQSIFGSSFINWSFSYFAFMDQVQTY